MKNFVQPGENIEYAHTSAVESGDAIVIGGLIGIATGKFAANVAGIYSLKGVYKFAKLSGFTAAIGVAVDHENTGKLVVATTTGDFALGKLFKPALNGELFAYVVLNNGV